LVVLLSRLAVATLSLVSLVLAAPVYAAVPNDDQETATEIVAPFPFTDFPDLNEATTSFAEFQQCGGSQEHAVWYRYTAGAVDEVLLYNFQPFSGAGVLTISENAGSCFVPEPTQLRPVHVLAGETLYLSVGTLAGTDPQTVVSVYADVRPLIHVDATLSAQATVNRAGYAIVTGTVSCDPVGEPPYQSIFVSAFIEQKSGHGFITGSGTTAVDCSASGPTNWSVEMQPFVPGGKFVAGRATVSIEAFVSAWRELGTIDSIGPMSVKVVARPK
jgi:hypothetical protein